MHKAALTAHNTWNWLLYIFKHIRVIIESSASIFTLHERLNHIFKINFVVLNAVCGSLNTLS